MAKHLGYGAYNTGVCSLQLPRIEKSSIFQAIKVLNHFTSKVTYNESVSVTAKILSSIDVVELHREGLVNTAIEHVLSTVPVTRITGDSSWRIKYAASHACVLLYESFGLLI